MPGDQNAHYVSAEEGDLYFRSQLLRRCYLNQCFFSKIYKFQTTAAFHHWRNKYTHQACDKIKISGKSVDQKSNLSTKTG